MHGGRDVGDAEAQADRRVVGASYATEKRYVEYFDPELKSLAAGLAKALGKGQAVSILDSSDDEKKLLTDAATAVQALDPTSADFLTQLNTALAPLA